MSNQRKVTRPVWLDAVADLAATGEYGLSATDLLLAHRLTMIAFDWRTLTQQRYLTHAQIGALIDASGSTSERFLRKMKNAGLLVVVPGSGKKLRAGPGRQTFLYRLQLIPEKHLRSTQMTGYVKAELQPSRMTAKEASGAMETDVQPSQVTVGGTMTRSGAASAVTGDGNIAVTDDGTYTGVETNTGVEPGSTVQPSQMTAKVPTPSDLTATAVRLLDMAADLPESPVARSIERIVGDLDVWAVAEWSNTRSTGETPATTPTGTTTVDSDLVGAPTLSPSAGEGTPDLGGSAVHANSVAGSVFSPRTFAAVAAPALGSADREFPPSAEATSADLGNAGTAGNPANSGRPASAAAPVVPSAPGSAAVAADQPGAVHLKGAPTPSPSAGSSESVDHVTSGGDYVTGWRRAARAEASGAPEAPYRPRYAR